MHLRVKGAVTTNGVTTISQPTVFQGDVAIRGNPSVLSNINATTLNNTVGGTQSNHLDVFGSVDMLDGPVHIKELIIDSLTIRGMTDNSNILLPPLLPSDPLFAVTHLDGGLVVEGYAWAKKGF